MRSGSTSADVLAYSIGLAFNASILGYGSHRLAGMRFSVPRLTVAGAVGLATVDPILNSLASISLYRFLGYSLLVIAGVLGLRLLAPVFRSSN